MARDFTITYRKTEDLHLLDTNPRSIRDHEFTQLCRSLRETPDFFEARPLILSNRTGKLVIIAGNMRYRAAIHIGFKQVPTYLMKGLTEEKEREITIKDNVSAGEWDWEMLANEWDANLLNDWGIIVPEEKKERKKKEKDDDSVSHISSKLKHTCPKCGHEWTKAD